MNNKAFPVWQVAVLLLAAVLIIPALVVSVQQPLAPLQLRMLRESGMAMAALAVLCFMVSSLTGNHSQVDKLWSIVPMGYVWYFAWMNNMEDRSVLMAVMVTIWGFRLTYNFARRGGLQLEILDRRRLPVVITQEKPGIQCHLEVGAFQPVVHQSVSDDPHLVVLSSGCSSCRNGYRNLQWLTGCWQLQCFLFCWRPSLISSNGIFSERNSVRPILLRRPKVSWIRDYGHMCGILIIQLSKVYGFYFTVLVLWPQSNGSTGL